MVKKKPEQGTSIDGRWYTAGEAAKVLTINSGREVKPDYLAKLGSMNKIRTMPVNSRLTLYNKEDIDAYRVEKRGKKSGNAAQVRSSKKKREAA